jgi:hypothetical protein
MLEAKVPSSKSPKISLSLLKVSGFFTGDCNVPQLSQLRKYSSASFGPGIDEPLCLPGRGKTPDASAQRGRGGRRYHTACTQGADTMLEAKVPSSKSPKISLSLLKVSGFLTTSNTMELLKVYFLRDDTLTENYIFLQHNSLGSCFC